MSFDSLGLYPEILQALKDKGYEKPSPIQKKAIPLILDGHDLLGGAQTGTGKTAAFTVPILQILEESNRYCANPRALIVTPTRELAAQVGQNVSDYGRNLNLSSSIIFGGVGMNPQIAKLKKGVDILIATPGRLLDHASQKNLDLSEIEILVLDEADRMLDMGFIHDIRKILRLLPKERQTLLFSATFSPQIKELADSFLHKPKSVEVARRNTAAESVSQVAYMVEKSQKRFVLSHLIREENWNQVLVFTRTKHGADRLAKMLNRDGIHSEVIHGNKSQNARTRALANFKDCKSRVLVATDIAARGLDISQLPYVVNYELPSVAEDYIHRIGRTGRAGESGRAIALISNEEKKEHAGIEKLMKKTIERRPVPEIDMSKFPKPQVQPQQKQARGGRPGRSPNAKPNNFKRSAKSGRGKRGPR